jgi:hypothetical protein
MTTSWLRLENAFSIGLSNEAGYTGQTVFFKETIPKIPRLFRRAEKTRRDADTFIPHLSSRKY